VKNEPVGEFASNRKRSPLRKFYELGSAIHNLFCYDRQIFRSSRIYSKINPDWPDR
jgi:hypothetical protein